MSYIAGTHYGKKKLATIGGAEALLHEAIQAANQDVAYFRITCGTVAVLSRKNGLQVLFGPATRQNLEVIKQDGFPTWWVIVSLLPQL